MTWKRAPLAICVGFQFLSLAAWAASAKSEAIFLGGTVHSIHPGARGTLEFQESQEIVFNSGSPAVRLPYSRITGFQFSDYRKPAKRLMGVKVPPVSLLTRDQILEVSFKDHDGVAGTASFRMSERARADAETVLVERIATGKRSAHSKGVKLPEQWWGDKNWKTTRNKAAWPDTSAEASPSLAGTQ